MKDTFAQQWFSANLYAFKDPILYNSYLGKDIYRFLWLQSFKLPLVFTISNENGEVFLHTKKLDREPMFKERRYSGDSESDSIYIAQGYQLTKVVEPVIGGGTVMVSIVKADRRANIIYDSTKTLLEEDWNQFVQLLNEGRFWKIPSYQYGGNADGAQWVFEAHTKQRYRYVVSDAPNEKLIGAGELLVKLSGLKEGVD